MTYIGEIYDILYREVLAGGVWKSVKGERDCRGGMLRNAAHPFVCASFFMYDAQCNGLVSKGNSFFLTGDFASSNHATNLPISLDHSRLGRDKKGSYQKTKTL